MGMIMKMGKGGYTCRKEEKEGADLDEKSDEFIVSFMYCYMIASLGFRLYFFPTGTVSLSFAMSLSRLMGSIC